LIEEILPEPSFKKAKIKTLPIYDKYISFNPKKANAVLDCGQILWFNLKEHMLTKEQKLKLAEMYTCKDRFCPFCNWRRQLKYSKLVYEYLDELQTKKSLRYIFLTLTVPNCHIDDLRATIEHMNKSFQRMKETKRFQKSILGYLRVLEYTVEKKRKDYVHPHFHILLSVEPKYFTDERYINQKEFLQMWRDATRNQNITQVDIRIIKPNKDKNATASAVAEMCKYPLKDTDISKLTTEQFEKLVLQLKGIRNINAGGNLKNILKGTEKMDNDLVHIDDEHNDQLWKIIQKISYCFETREKKLNYYLGKQFKIMENENG
jgi:plasmid rolling circle replication initiator protein Rep